MSFPFVNFLFVSLCILCVKMKISLCEKSVLHHDKRTCLRFSWVITKEQNVNLNL